MTDPPPHAAAHPEVDPEAAPDRGPAAPRARRRAWRRPALWALLVAALLWTPGSDGPSRWPLTDRLAALAEAGGDKVVHALLFAVQAWLLCRARPGGARWRAACFALAAGYGALTEAGQLLVAGRDAGLPDALANTAGAALGVALHARLDRDARR